MNIAAIIAEYDPFHTGHAYHLQKTREISGADAVICIMSGSFVQRGRPACIDKFTRTRLALEGGADMVLELPSVYSLQSAEFFARGAVRLLEASNMVDHLSFGVEQEIVSAGNPDAEALRASLDAGEPYSRALGSELAPNSLLGAEYLRAIEELGSNIKCIQVRRNGAGHDSMEMSHNLSASRLRAMMAENKDVSPYTKVNAARYLDGEKMFVPLLCALRSMQPEQIEGISQVSEGLQYLIKEGARSAKSLDGLIMACKSKRYTYSRLSRIMCCAFLGITSQMTDSANKSFPYIRVLGVKKNRTDLLGALNSKADLPVCVNSADFLKNADEECAAAFLHECKVTDLRAALNGEEAGADFTNGLILV